MVPQLRRAVVSVLGAAPGQRLRVNALIRQARKEVDRTAHEAEGCTGACARVEVPTGRHLHPILQDLHARGDIGYSAVDKLYEQVEEREVWLLPAAAEAVAPT